MRLEIRRHRRALTGREADRVFRGCFLVAIGAGYCAIAASALGSPPTTGSLSPTTNPSPLSTYTHWPASVQLHSPRDSKLDYLAAHAPTVDPLYEELMRWTEPACWSASADASVAGTC
jgi:hypothetical protein